MKKVSFAKGLILSLALFLFITACSGGGDTGGPVPSGGNASSEGQSEEQPKAQAGKQELVVVSWGGAGTDAQREAWYKPFTEATGIEIIEVTPPSTAQVVAQVDSGAVEWDVVLMDHAQIGSILQLGDYLEEIPYDRMDPGLLAELPDEVKTQYGVGAYYWGWTLAYRTDAFDEVPQGWEDFWDVERFPGPRTMTNRPWANLEVAMIAQGRAKDEVYPIDFDSGFAKLEEVAPHISSFWTAGAEGIQLLADNQAVIGLVFTAQAISNKNQGVPVEVQWNDAIYSMDNWVIPKGNMSENALKFIEFVSQADRQAEVTKYIPYGPINEQAFDLIDDSLKQDLITYPENLEKMFKYDSDWWAPQRDELTERWNEWLLNL